MYLSTACPHHSYPVSAELSEKLFLSLSLSKNLLWGDKPLTICNPLPRTITVDSRGGYFLSRRLTKVMSQPRAMKVKLPPKCHIIPRNALENFQGNHPHYLGGLKTTPITRWPGQSPPLMLGILHLDPLLSSYRWKPRDKPRTFVPVTCSWD